MNGVKIYLKAVTQQIFKEMVELKLIDLNEKDRMFAIANRKKKGSAKTYYVVDYLVREYFKYLG